MTMSESPLVTLKVVEDIAFLHLDNPPVNILSAALMDRLSAHLETIAADHSLKGVAITAAGKAFCAGADVGEHRPERAAGMIASFGQLFRRLEALEIPLVMAVQGAALGAGFELALMADILLASDEAVLGQPEIRLGFFAPVGVVLLPQLVGRARALEITATGRNYTAAEMAAMGLVSRVTPAAELNAALTAVLKDLRRASPLVLRLNTRTLKRVSGADFVARLELAERVFLDELMTSEDPGEGIEAFYGKRRPEWRNR
jgi:cyclohexa-1,5-dienecarbonyl-CoA hydratase